MFCRQRPGGLGEKGEIRTVVLNGTVLGAGRRGPAALQVSEPSRRGHQDTQPGSEDLQRPQDSKDLHSGCTKEEE